jgi:hypothetical protein
MKKYFEIFSVSLIVLALSFISTFPLVKHFNTSIPWASFRGDLKWTLMNHPGDQLQIFYFFWLVKENILGRVPFNSNPYEFNMLGGATAGNDGLTTAPLAFISFLCSPLGNTVAYNCTIVSSYIFAGVFMYLLAKLITPSRTAALLAAVIFTFVPLRINGLGGGQQYAFVLFMYPMIFYFLEKCLRETKIRYSILAGLSIVGLSFNEPHLIYYLYMILAGYLPVRLVSLFPVNESYHAYVPLFRAKMKLSWRPWLSLLVVYGGGAALVVYAHSVLPLYHGESFLSKRLLLMLGYYPIILVLLSIMLAAIYSHLSHMLSFSKALVIEARSMLPLYVFIILSPIFYGEGGNTTAVLLYSVITSLCVKIFYLKPYLAGMAFYFQHHVRKMWRSILILSPAIILLVGNAFFTVVAKKTSLAPSTETGGRTLEEVRLFSAHLPDIFQPTSSVYLGLLPALMGIIFLIFLLYRSVNADREWQQQQANLPLWALLGIVLLTSYGLALGLALGDRSLYVLFFNYFPYFNFPRISDRIACVTIFVLACLCASVGGAFIRAYHARMWQICSSIVILVAAGFQLKSYSITTPMALTDLRPIEDGYQYIKDNIDDKILLELPLWPGDSHQSSVYQYYITLDQTRRVNGYTPLVSREYFHTIFTPLHSLNRGFLNSDQYTLLRDLQVKFITVHEHTDIFTDKVSPHPPLTTVRRLRMSPYLEYLGPWPIMNVRYDKVHERLFLFKIREQVSSGKTDDFYTMPTIYRPGGYLRQQTGRIDEDPVTGKKVYHGLPERDRPGFLTYGPYRSFFSGKYSCYFRLKCSPGADSAGKIDIVRLQQDKPDLLTFADLKHETCDGTYRNVELEFEISQREQLGFRVFFQGTSEISLEKIVVRKKDQATPFPLLEAEKLPGETGSIVAVDSASGKMVIEAKPGRDGEGKMVYGPGTQLKKGWYSAMFHLRTPVQPLQQKRDNPTSVILRVTAHQSDTIFTEIAVRAADIDNETFHPIKVNFTLPEAEEVDYEVFFTDEIPIQLDAIEIKEITMPVLPNTTVVMPQNQNG